MSPTSHYVGALGFTSQKNSHESVEVIAWYVTEMTFAKLPNSPPVFKKNQCLDSG